VLALSELIELLKDEDEVSLLEMLEITSIDIVERFSDFIENKYDLLTKEKELDNE
jgi:hypothetical protein